MMLAVAKGIVPEALAAARLSRHFAHIRYVHDWLMQ